MGYGLWPITFLLASLMAWNGWRYYVRFAHGAAVEKRVAAMETALIERSREISAYEKRIEAIEKTIQGMRVPRAVPTFGAQRFQRG